MADWLDAFRSHCVLTLPQDMASASVQEQFAWVTSLHAQAREALAPARLRAEPPHTIYAALQTLSFPQCPLRVVNLGKANAAQQVVDGLLLLLETAGDFEDKFRAARFPQAGMVTVSELLCAAKPARFCIRNTALLRAVAKVMPLYPMGALREMPYAEFLDLMREMARAMTAHFAHFDMETWAEEHRFLALYAILVCPNAD